MSILECAFGSSPSECSGFAARRREAEHYVDYGFHLTSLNRVSAGFGRVIGEKSPSGVPTDISLDFTWRAVLSVSNRSPDECDDFVNRFGIGVRFAAGR